MSPARDKRELGKGAILHHVLETVAEASIEVEMRGDFIDMGSLSITRRSSIVLDGDPRLSGPIGPPGVDEIYVDVRSHPHPAVMFANGMTRDLTWTHVGVPLDGPVEEQTFEQVCDAFARLYRRLGEVDAGPVALGTVHLWHPAPFDEDAPLVDVLEVLALLPGPRPTGSFEPPRLPL